MNESWTYLLNCSDIMHNPQWLLYLSHWVL